MLKNNPRYISLEEGSNFHIENDPTCSMVPRVVIQYKLHWDGMGVKFER